MKIIKSKDLNFCDFLDKYHSDEIIDNEEMFSLINDNDNIFDTLSEITDESYEPEIPVSEVAIYDYEIDSIENYEAIIEAIPLEEWNDADPKEMEIFKSNQKNNLNNEDEKVKSVSYRIFKKLCVKYKFKCCNEQMFVYSEEQGRYMHVDDNRLKVIIRKGWDEKIQEKLSRNVLIEIIERLRTEPCFQVEDDYFNYYNYKINFLNGVLDLRTNKFSKHSHNFRFTHCIQGNYDSNPKGGETFKMFLETSLQNDFLKEQQLQEILGYILSEFYTAKKAPMIVGKPHSGKSTLNRVISTLIGKEHVAHVPIHRLHERFMLAHLSTMKVNVCSEISDEALSNIEVFKAITGNDELVAEYKGKNHFTYMSKIKLLFSGNSMPKLKNRDVTSAFFDRLIFLNFNYTVPEEKRDHMLENKLLNEDRSYIVHWAVEGVKRLMNNNFKFSECEESSMYKRRYIFEQNNTIDFINDYCVLESVGRVHLRELFNAYLEYCHENCFTPCSKEDFFLEISKHDVKKKKFRMNGSNALWGYQGIKLKNIA